MPTSYDGTCFESNLPALSVVDSDPLALGSGYFYLIRGTNVCGDGTYGYDSAGSERESTICP